jgi:hypothetical protein
MRRNPAPEIYANSKSRKLESSGNSEEIKNKNPIKCFGKGIVMRLNFEIPAHRVQEIINCVNDESELDKRINSFEILKLDCRDGVVKDVFIVTLCSDNAFFIQRMAEAAREKTEEKVDMRLRHINSGTVQMVASLKKPQCVGVEIETVELKHYDKTAISQGDQDGRTE